MEWIVEPNEAVEQADESTCWCWNNCYHCGACPSKRQCYCSMTAYSSGCD